MPSLPLPAPWTESTSILCRDITVPGGGPIVTVDPDYALGRVLVGAVQIGIAQAIAVAEALDALSTLDTDETSEADRIQVDGVGAFAPISIAAIQVDDVVTQLQIGAAAPLTRGQAASVAEALRQIVADQP